MLCKKAMIWGVISMLAMAVLAWITLPLIVPILMPKYVKAIPTMCLMMIILVLIIFELPFTILVAMGKLMQQNIAVYSGLCCFVLCALAAIKLGLGLNGIVGSSLFGKIVKIIITYIFIYSNDHREKFYSLPGESPCL